MFPLVYFALGNSVANGGADNSVCADVKNLPPGKGKFFRCKPTAYGRYVAIRIPGSGKYVMICEVEVYSTISSKY